MFTHLSAEGVGLRTRPVDTAVCAPKHFAVLLLEGLVTGFLIPLLDCKLAESMAVSYLLLYS